MGSLPDKAEIHHRWSRGAFHPWHERCIPNFILFLVTSCLVTKQEWGNLLSSKVKMVRILATIAERSIPVQRSVRDGLLWHVISRSRRLGSTSMFFWFKTAFSIPRIPTARTHSPSGTLSNDLFYSCRFILGKTMHITSCEWWISLHESVFGSEKRQALLHMDTKKLEILITSKSDHQL